MELFNPPLEHFSYFRKQKPEKFLIFSQKKAFLIFQETELSYISGKTIQNPDTFRFRSIFRTLVYLEPEAYSEHCQISAMECFVKIAT